MTDVARVVLLETTHGVLAVELYDDTLTGGIASSFLRLAASGQLEGECFSSMVPGVGVVGAARGAEDGRVLGLPWRHGTLRSPPDPVLKHVGAGLLTCRPCEGVVPGSTFLITLGPQPKLDREYTVFGRISAGMGLVEKISRMEVDDAFKLFSPVSVTRCTVVQQPKPSRPVAATAATASPAEAALLKVAHRVQSSLLGAL